MPTIKQHVSTSPQPKLKYERVGNEILRMYKYFPELEYVDIHLKEPPTKGCFVTMIMLDSGYIYTRRTKDKPTTSQIGQFKRTSKWIFEKQTTADPKNVRYHYLGLGWKVPRGYNLENPQIKSIKNGIPTEDAITKLSKSDLKRLEERDQRTDLARQFDNLRARTKVPLPLVSEPKELNLTLESSTQEVKSEPKFKRPIPKISESWFWNLTLEEQNALLKVWGYDVSGNTTKGTT